MGPREPLGGRNARQAAAAAALAVSMAVPLLVTLWPLPDSDAARVSLVPFATLRTYLASPGTGVGELLNVPGNVALFVPLGFLAPLASAAFRGLWRTMLLGTALSVTIEVAQFLFVVGRTADTTDVILNAAGTLLGYGLSAVVAGSRHR